MLVDAASHTFSSLEFRLCVPEFVSQLCWFFSKTVKQNPERKAWVQFRLHFSPMTTEAFSQEVGKFFLATELPFMQEPTEKPLKVY